MSPRTLVIAALCAAIAIFTAPLIASGIDSFKTFLELAYSFHPCEGAGSQPPCHHH